MKIYFIISLIVWAFSLAAFYVRNHIEDKSQEKGIRVKSYLTMLTVFVAAASINVFAALLFLEP